MSSPSASQREAIRDGRRGMKARCVVLAVLAMCSLRCADSTSERSTDRSTEVKCQAFVEKFRAVETGKEVVPLEAADRDENLTEHDQRLAKTTKQFSGTLASSELDAVAAFADSEAAGSYEFVFVHLMILRGRVDLAARIVVGAMVRHPDRTAPGTWKWWYHGYSERADFDALCQQFTDALLGEFERGDPGRRRVVARLFDKGDAEARLTVEEFKAAVGIGRSESEGK